MNRIIKTDQRVIGGIRLLGTFILFVATSPPAYPAEAGFPTQLSRVQFKLTLIKLDLIRLYQSEPAASARTGPSASSPARSTSPSSPEKAGDAPSGLSFRNAPDLREIADLMKELERVRNRNATGDLPVEEMQLRLGTLQFEAGLTAQAEQTLKSLATQTRRPIADESWFQLQRLYYQRGEYQQALGAFLKISEKSPSPPRPEALYLAGNSYLYLKENRKAAELLERVGQGSEDYPFALYASGLARLHLNPEGIAPPEAFEKLLAFNPGDDPVRRELINKARMTMGFYWIEHKQFTEAIDLLDAVPPESIYRVPARYGIGTAYLGMEECVKAIVMFQELVETAPTDPYTLGAYLPMGACYSRLNAYHRALENYLNALETYSARKEELRQLGEAVRNLDPVSTGIENLPAHSRRALAVERDFPELLEVQGDWLWLSEQMAQADRQGLSVGSEWRSLQERMKEIQRDLGELWRSAMSHQLSVRTEQIDGFIRRASIGIAKNMILLQDHALAR